MNHPRTSIRRPLRAASRLVLAGACMSFVAGCKSFLDQSELTRGNRAERLVVPILSSIDPIDVGESEFPNATDVMPQDLKVFATDYEIGRNDVVTVSVYDLVGGGVETVRTAKVSETGMLSLPMLGEPVAAAGLTEAELQRAVADKYREAGILQNAQVSVTVVEQRQRTFSAWGAVGRPGQYAILESDFRLIDALIQVGDATHPAEFIYILRKKRQDTPRGEQGVPDGGPGIPGGMDGVPQIAPPPGMMPRGPATGPTDLAPQGAVTPDQQPGLSAIARSALLMQETAAQPATAQPGQEERYIYIDGKPVLVPATNRAVVEPATPGVSTQVETATPPVVAPPTTVDRQEVMPAQPQVEPGVSTSVPPPVSPDTMEPGRSGEMSETTEQRPYEFGAGLEEPNDIRVIRVPLQALRMGDLRYNVVIRPSDTLIVPNPVVGEYYVGGHAAGGGVFSLTGRQITLKQAIVSARMLDPLAVPWRTDIVRRIGGDKEVFVRVNLALIFEGRQPDIFLKPNDVITVGTDWYAPFLAAIRGAFRASYGFGFIYDRNFAPQQEFADDDPRFAQPVAPPTDEPLQ